MTFSESRALHCRSVGLLMLCLAPVLGIDSYTAWLAGFNHDCGYATGDNRSHAAVGGLALRQAGFHGWQAVALHGTPAGLESPLGVLLNIADMSVDSHGRVVGFQARLADVAARYGRDSVQYAECSDMVSRLERSLEWARVGTLSEGWRQAGGVWVRREPGVWALSVDACKTACLDGHTPGLLDSDGYRALSYRLWEGALETGVERFTRLLQDS